MSEARTLSSVVRVLLPSAAERGYSAINAHAALDELERRASAESCAHTLARVRDALERLADGAPLPPAESCAHAVARFREALLLLTKRHEVEVEVGHIEAGVCGGGIEDLPDAGEVDAEYRAQFDGAVREAAAWRKIDRWSLSNRMTSVVHVGPLVSKAGWFARAMQVDEKLWVTAGDNLTKLEALEALAQWCEGQP